MDVQFAILGLLDWRPMAGYDLKKLMEESEVFYWSGNNNQIYNSLVALSRAGLVEGEAVMQEGLPAKKVYSITEAGRERLREWLLSEPELPEVRNHFLVRLALAEGLTGEELDGLLGRYEAELEVQVRMRAKRLSRAGTSTQSPGRTARGRFLRGKVEAHAAGVYARELEWVRQVREDLRQENFVEQEVGEDGNDR